jgi:hypothetical protein
MDLVPVTGFAVNFSPIPQIAPPPLESEIDGAETNFCSSEIDFSLWSWCERFAFTAGLMSE